MNSWILKHADARVKGMKATQPIMHSRKSPHFYKPHSLVLHRALKTDVKILQREMRAADYDLQRGFHFQS